MNDDSIVTNIRKWLRQIRTARTHPQRYVTLERPCGIPTLERGNDQIILSATAADPDGQLARVDFYRDGSRIGSAASAPYTGSAHETEKIVR